MSEAYLAEIAEQPGILDRLGAGFDASWGAPLAKVRADLEAGRFDRVLLTGMGGSLHGAYPAYLALSRALSVPVLLWESGELTQQAAEVVTARSLLIAISQSGESGEVRRLTEFPTRPACAISITNTADNALARWADVAIATHAGPERTASTKTYTAGLAAAHLVVAHLTGKTQSAANEVRDLSQTVAALIASLPTQAEAAAHHLGHSTPLTVIGRGDSYASAAMAALLTEEAAKLPCEALTGGQFRHGPLELVRDGFRAVVYLGEGPARRLTKALVERIVALGGRVVTIGTDPGPASAAVLPIALPEVPAGLLPVLEILPVQFLVIPLAIARGFEPAAFLNAQKITTGE
ncbi:SIS domain-containing protein [Tabrizicola oligotrophica]|uniref:Glutamine--fructose-6-phosphate aminotransferase [isomerizing] n=1 Tax=Tabrizicola oligotrophica TaxID=2710650 RepID=A0A6M0QXR1_9RHOB|nr:SIS domain-containing protein [Tabrizicola oligotrophica]NEY91741.1 SIS domain-containing protein [Tabrizicola oligotrophica]